MTFSLVIRDGLVADGAGGEVVEADVYLVDGVVAAIDPAGVTAAGDVIDASGLIVAPGFIDTHTHSDALPFLGSEHDDPRLGSLRQGVTTEIAGNCGFSLFPAPGGAAGAAVACHLESLLGSGTRTAISIADYASALRQVPMAASLVSLVGQGTLRAAVVEFDRRPATAEELSEMTELADAALAGGAAGLSTGLLYPPGSYASTDEVVALAAVAARHGHRYVSHIRNEMDGVVAALEEALAIDAASGAAVHALLRRDRRQCGRASGRQDHDQHRGCSSLMVESGIGVRLRRLHTALLCDVLDAMGLRSSSVGVGIEPLRSDMKVVGRAFTMKCVRVDRVPDEPYVELLAGCSSIQAGEVVVLETGDRVSAMWGELLSTATMVKGAVGAVLDGMVRDVDQILEIGEVLGDEHYGWPADLAELCWFYGRDATPSMSGEPVAVNIFDRFIDGWEGFAAVCRAMRLRGAKRICIERA